MRFKNFDVDAQVDDTKRYTRRVNAADPPRHGDRSRFGSAA
jgi:hypothetical protein